MPAQEQYTTFRLAGQILGVPVSRVQEVLRRQKMTCVPLASPEVSGLINLRGQIVTAIDLRRRLSLPERQADVPVMNVIIRTDAGPVSLLVDEIGDVIDVGSETFEGLPDTASAETRALISGVHKLPGGLLMILNVEKALQLNAGGE